MAAGGGVRVDGVDELTSSLATLTDDLDDIEPAGRKAGAVVKVNAQRRVPRKSGRLAGSIQVDTADAAGGTVTVTAGGGPIRYAGVQEGGWPARNIRPHWYMRDALRAESDRVVDIYAADVTDKTDKVKGA